MPICLQLSTFQWVVAQKCHCVLQTCERLLHDGCLPSSDANSHCCLHQSQRQKPTTYRSEKTMSEKKLIVTHLTHYMFWTTLLPGPCHCHAGKEEMSIEIQNIKNTVIDCLPHYNQLHYINAGVANVDFIFYFRKLYMGFAKWKVKQQVVKI